MTDIIKELMIDQEVRIRYLEMIAGSIDNKFNHLESKIQNQFYWVIGTILGQIALTMTFLGGIILHLSKLQ